MATVTDAELITAYGTMVRRIAGRVQREVGRPAEQEDLTQAGLVALIACAKSFNGSGDFRAFAAQRVRWAMLDAHRREMPLARGEWRKVKAGTRPFTLVALGAARAVTVDPDTRDVIAARAVRAALRRLPMRERFVLVQTVVRGRTLADLAPVLDVTEGRVAQLRTAALARVRAALGITSTRTVRESVANGKREGSTMIRRIPPNRTPLPRAPKANHPWRQYQQPKEVA